MAPDLKEVLRDAAARPSDSFDVDDVRRRAAGVARGRRLRVAGAGLAVVALVAVAAVPVVGLLRDPDVEFADTVPPVAEPASEVPGAPPETWERLPPAP